MGKFKNGAVDDFRIVDKKLTGIYWDIDNVILIKDFFINFLPVIVSESHL